jgi:hypothetical protein
LLAGLPATGPAQTPAPPVLSTAATTPAGADTVPAQMSGLPLQVADLPPGIVVVRVIRQSFAQDVSGQPVELHRASGPVMTGLTDADGRARFEGLQVRETVHARTTVAGELLASQRFEVPDRGGVRLVLVAGVGAGSPWGASAGSASVNPPSADQGTSPRQTAVAIPLAVAFLGMSGGVAWMARRPRKSARRAPDPAPAAAPAASPRAALLARREALMNELVAVERALDPPRQGSA